MAEFIVKPGGSWKKKIFGFIAILVLIGGYLAYQSGYLPGRPTNKVETAKLDEMSGKYVKESAASFSVPKVPLPSGDELVGKPFLIFNTYDWHGNTAFTYANGGPITLDNSLIGKEGLLVKIVHQDDTPTSIKEFMNKAAQFKESDGASGGNLAFTIMGSGAVPLIEPLQEELKSIDPEYRAICVDLVGKSDGEDQVIGPKEWLTNPEAMRGKMLVGVYDDGDVHIGVMYADKVGIPVNFDYHTYNPEALNLEAVGDFMKAGRVFTNTRELESRPVVDANGRKTGKTTKDLGIVLRPDAVASWTPVDRNIVRDLMQTDPDRLKSLATITSTGSGDQKKVMPTALIVLNKYYEKNLDKFARLSYAIHMGGMQVERYPDALERAMAINTDIMGIWDEGADPRAATRERLNAYRGYAASQNKALRIGGSTVFSFRDAMNMVGVTDNGDDLANSTFASVYRSFGNLTVRKYPEKGIKSFVSFEQFFDPRALKAAYARAKSEGLGTAEVVKQHDYQQSTGEVIGSTNFSITFRTGSAELSPSATLVLQEIQDNYASSEYGITIVGHTDRTGSDEVNGPLSYARAETVKNYLVARNRADFGGDRISVEGKGSKEPAAGVNPGYTGENAKCRRVEIVIHR